jgi:AraC family transcriptional regulator
VRRALDYIEGHLGDDIGVLELSAVAALSPAHFTKMFRGAVGMPPHRWLLERRLERAQAMLADPRASVTEIALACGFGSSQHFATAFRKSRGVTPSDYRRSRRS